MKKKFVKENFLLFVLGIFSAFSLPPFNFFLINFFTLSIFFIFLFKRLKKETKKIFFYYGWFLGFGYFLSNLYWITISLTFDENLNFLIPIALVVIPSFLALFYGLITFLFYLISSKNLLSAFFIFSLLFGIVEYVRGTILSGFPWNLFVYSFSKNLNFISIISLIGTYSLNLIVISLFTAPAIYVLKQSKKDIWVCVLIFLLPISFLTYGTLQKQKFLNKEEKNIPYTIRIIGSKISLDRYYDTASTESVIEELILLSSPMKNKKIFFLWPEAIIPNIYRDEMYLYNDIFKKNFDENHVIGLGIINRQFINNEYQFYNSFSIFDNELNLLENYDKNNLVPFGEFIPFENLFNKIGLKVISNNFGSFSKGKKRNIIEIKDNFEKFKFLPLICYEIIFSGNLSKNFDFDFIFNISEDGWFGKSIGPQQHFTHSIFRAIENGKYVIRSANNGIAAVINPLGEIEQQINFGEDGYIDFNTSKNVDKTIFSTFGNLIFVFLILLYIFLIFSFNRINQK